MIVKLTQWLLGLLLFLATDAFSQNCDFIISTNHAGPTCPDGKDGWINLTIEGSSDPYYFFWQTLNGSGLNVFSQNQNGLLAGLYVVAVTDTTGCEQYLEIELLDGTDPLPPIVICPNSQNINLGPGECSRVVNFDITATDNCVAAPLIAQTDSMGFSSGDAFPIGTTTLSFETSDGFHTVSCSFIIIINEYNPQGNSSISCAGPLNISVTENCMANLSAGMLLNGIQHGCYDDYQVSFINAGGMPIIETDFPNYLGKTIYGKVYDPDNNTHCFSTIHLHDFLKPVIHCLDTIEVSCGAGPEEVHPASLGFPEVTDNCSSPTFDFFDQFNDLSCDSLFFGGQYSAWIKRTWTATDERGNEAVPCIQSIFFKRKRLDDVVFPLNLTDQPNALPSLNCGAVDDSPAVTGAPTVDGMPIYPSAMGHCEFQVTYSDLQTVACGGGYNILRTWTVSDACNNEVRTHMQGIQIKDKIPPVITCLPSYSVSTNTGSCKATFFAPQPQVSDECSSFYYHIEQTSGSLSGNILQNVPVGQYQITYRASDDCGNQSFCQMSLSVYDGQPPNAKCDASKAVSLTTTGATSLSASIFNKNSTEDCGGQLQFAVRRLDDLCGVNGTVWANKVKFCCEDIGTSIPVELKVTDYSGNYDVCNSVVHISDFLPPSLTCPSSFSVSCDTDFSDLSIFGKIATSTGQQSSIVINGTALGMDGIMTDNCSAVVEELAADFNLDACHEGIITRHFKATDPASLTALCSQQITVVNNAPFYINSNNLHDPNDDVEFPPHIIISDCSGNANPNITGQPFILREGCGEVNFTHSDQILSQNANSYVIKRKWTVVDFCQFGNGQGQWIYFQNITVHNSDVMPPQMNGFVEIVRYCGDDNDCQSGYVSFVLQATDDCTPNSLLVWEYTVDLDNDGSIDLTGNSNAIFGTLPLGIHKTVWKVMDEAGNTSTGIQFLLGDDCTPPAPTCHDTLYVTLNSDATLYLPAENMQAGFSQDNCSEYADLRFEVNVFDPDYQENFPLASALTTMNFSCPVATYHLQLWVGDENDNWSNCVFHLDVSDYFLQCDEVPQPPISIEGNILTEQGQPVGQVTIQVNTNTPAITDGNGYYAFHDLPPGSDYSVLPRKDIAPLNGVTTYDLVLIRRHVLGVELLDSPYKLIAADVNKSNTVTTSDLVALQKLILHVDANFENNESWRFVDADFVFSNPMNPFETAFPEWKNFNNLSLNSKADFIGVKIGDVNGSADALSLLDLGGMECLLVYF